MNCIICNVQTFSTISEMCDDCCYAQEMKAASAEPMSATTYYNYDINAWKQATWKQPTASAPVPIILSEQIEMQQALEQIMVKKASVFDDVMGVPRKKKRKIGSGTQISEEPLATLIQEQPYKIYQIKKMANSKELLTWLNEVKDTNFGITMGKETIRFKTHRDVSNFMLGFNVCSDMMSGAF